MCVFAVLSIQVVALDGKRNKDREAVRKLKKLHPSLDKQSTHKMKCLNVQMTKCCVICPVYHCIWLPILPLQLRFKDMGLLWSDFPEDGHKSLH